MALPNILNFASKAQSNPFRKGDAAIIIRGEEIIPVTFEIDADMVDAISKTDIDDMTAEELTVVSQGQSLFLLTMAARSEVIMTFLSKMALTPGADDIEKMKKAVLVQ